MGISQFFPIDFVEPILLCYGFYDVIVESLQRVGHIRVLVDSPIIQGYVFFDYLSSIHEQVVGAESLPLLPVEDISLGGFGVPLFNQNFFHDVLNIFHGGNTGPIGFVKHSLHQQRQSLGFQLILSAYGPSCRKDSVFNLCNVVVDNFTVAFLNLANSHTLISRCALLFAACDLRQRVFRTYLPKPRDILCIVDN